MLKWSDIRGQRFGPSPLVQSFNTFYTATLIKAWNDKYFNAKGDAMLKWNDLSIDERNALIAEHIFDYRWYTVNVESDDRPRFLLGPHYIASLRKEVFSKNYVLARGDEPIFVKPDLAQFGYDYHFLWSIVLKMYEKGFFYEIKSDPEDMTCTMVEFYDNKVLSCSSHIDALTAVCISALQALGIEIE